MRRVFGLLLLAIALLTVGCDVENIGNATAVPGQRATVPVEASAVQGGERTEAVTYRVVRVVDGDTIIVDIDGRQERLRYIGVDTPESVQPNTPVECYGIEASDQNKRLVEGQWVELERDVSDRDRFDRLLRYVYVTVNGERIFVNEALVAGGFAHSSTFPPDVKYQDRFRAAQRDARDNQRGLWGTCPP